LKILALETTERIGSLAIHDGDKLLDEKSLDAGQRTAQSLAPGVKTLLAEVGWAVKDLDLVAVTIGPGSFTGLRIGVTTAKTLAYAAGGKVLGLDTLEVVAAQTPTEFDRVSVAIDAQRGEVVAGTFTRDKAGHFDWETPAQLLPAEAWLSSLAAGTAVSGPIVRRLLDQVPVGLTVVKESHRIPRAATVAELAARAYREGRRDDLWQLAPKYSRRSAAEERWEERHS
jgi:tRNA threonylcarbamoyladenosine biosynthesis protein TsaB